MKEIQEETKLLASLAVFRELYDSDKDVYGVISDFINDIIYTEGLHSFSLQEITEKLNTAFEFDLHEAVVKTSLKKLDFIKKEQGLYIAQLNLIKKDINVQALKVIKQSGNETIISKLFKYIEINKNISLPDNDKRKIMHSFCSFLLDTPIDNGYNEYISAYIVENEDDKEFKDQLKQIREGIILYSGIKYNNNINDFGSWHTELTIFIDTEVLFFLGGLNGELSRNLVKDFLDYVREINLKSSKKLIKLKYFREVREEINHFFNTAQDILKGKERLMPGKIAMASILNGTKRKSDIVSKKSDFYNTLKKNDIEEDSFDDYSLLENYTYNIISQEIIDAITKEINKDAEPFLKFLNYISIRRKESNSKNFENIGYLLLTGNKTTLKVAWDERMKENGNVPMATDLNFLISKFWFKLNKGFGDSSLPKSFDIMSKCQLILAKVLNESVGEKYVELQKQFKEGTLTEDQAKDIIIKLRNDAKKPEEINKDTIPDVLHVITEEVLEKYIEEQGHSKREAEKMKEKNADLELKLEKSKESNKELLEIKINKKIKLQKQKEDLDKRARNKYMIFKIAIGINFLILTCGFCFLIFAYSWNVMEPFTIIFTFAPLIIVITSILIFEKKVDYIEYLKLKKIKYINTTYLDAEFEIENIYKITREIDELKKEIDS